MNYPDELAEEIINFINEKVKDLDNVSFRDVLESVELNISDQLQCLTEDEEAGYMEDDE